MDDKCLIWDKDQFLRSISCCTLDASGNELLWPEFADTAIVEIIRFTQPRYHTSPQNLCRVTIPLEPFL